MDTQNKPLMLTRRDMQQRVTEHSAYITISVPLNTEAASPNMFRDMEGNEIDVPAFMRKGGRWELTVDLKTHKVLDWKPEYGELVVWAKPVDTGRYTLRDEDLEPFCQLKSFVPNNVIPPYSEATWGDFLGFSVHADGSTVGWTDHYDFTDFTEHGDSVLSVREKRWVVEQHRLQTKKRQSGAEQL